MFSAVARSVEAFDINQGAFRGWLWTITRNKLNDFFRKASNRPQAIGGSGANVMVQLLPDNVPGESETIELSSLTRRLLDEVRVDFEESSWTAFLRTVVDGAAPVDVAAELGMSRWAVYKAKSRVLTRLRQRLCELGEFMPNE